MKFLAILLAILATLSTFSLVDCTPIVVGSCPPGYRRIGACCIRDEDYEEYFY